MYSDVKPFVCATIADGSKIISLCNEMVNISNALQLILVSALILGAMKETDVAHSGDYLDFLMHLDQYLVVACHDLESLVV